MIEGYRAVLHFPRHHNISRLLFKYSVCVYSNWQLSQLSVEQFEGTTSAVPPVHNNITSVLCNQCMTILLVLPL